MKFKKLVSMISLAIMCAANTFAMGCGDMQEDTRIVQLRNYMLDVAKKVISPENKMPLVGWLKGEGLDQPKDIYSVWAYNCYDMTYYGGERLSKEHKEKFRKYVYDTTSRIEVSPYSLAYFWGQRKYGDLYWLLRAHDGGMTSWTYKILNDCNLLKSEHTLAQIRKALRGIENRPDFFGNCFIGALVAANKCEELGLEWSILCLGCNDHWECMIKNPNKGGTPYLVNFIGCVHNLTFPELNPELGVPHYVAVISMKSVEGLQWQLWFKCLLGMSAENSKNHSILKDDSMVGFEDTVLTVFE